MELSPEDRYRIYQEEKARREAPASQGFLSGFTPTEADRLNAEAAAKQNNRPLSNSAVLGIGVAGIVIFVLIAALTPECSTRPSETVQRDATMAYIMATRFIKKRLKAPSTADFASPVWDKTDVEIVDLGNGEFSVSGWVDAQNSFGAKIRSNWACKLKYIEGNTWETTGFCGLVETH